MIITGDEEKIGNAALKALFTEKENCFRASMMTGLGGNVEQQNALCCSVCNPSGPSGDDTDILQVGRAPPRKKRRVAVRKLLRLPQQH